MKHLRKPPAQPQTPAQAARTAANVRASRPHSRKHRQRPPHGNALIAAHRTQANSAPTAAQSRGNNLLLKCAKKMHAVVPDKTE